MSNASRCKAYRNRQAQRIADLEAHVDTLMQKIEQLNAHVDMLLPPKKTPSHSPNPTPLPPNADALGHRDPLKAFWQDAVGYFTAAGVKEVRARPFVGKLRKQFGEPAVMAAIAQAEAEGPVDPISFIVGCLNREKVNGRRSSAVENLYRGFAEAARGEGGFDRALTESLLDGR